MTPENAKTELEKRIKQSGVAMSELTPAQGIRLMLDFYRDVRADHCEIEEDGDMLLINALQRTAAGHRGCNPRVLWPPSLRSGR